MPDVYVVTYLGKFTNFTSEKQISKRFFTFER